MDDNKDKKMKIKINFKPYIRKNGNRRKQDPPEFKFNKERKLHPSLKDDEAKAVIKVVEISLLKEPKQVSNSSEEEIICIDIDENISNVVADNSTENQRQENNKAHESSSNVFHFNNWQINNDNEPLDLSRKGLIPQTSPLFIEDPSPLFIEDPSPLDLSRTREQPQSFNVGEPPPLVPIERIGQEFAQTIPVFSIRGNHLNQCKTFNPFHQSVRHPFHLAKPAMPSHPCKPSMQAIHARLGILQPIQSVLTGSSFLQAGPENIFHVPRPPSPASRDNSINHKIIPENLDNSNVGKISKRKSTKPGIYQQNILETQVNCIEPSNLSQNRPEDITDIKLKKKSIAKPNIQGQVKASLNVKAPNHQLNFTDSPFSPTSSSKSNYQKQPVNNKNIPNGGTSKNKQKASKIPSNIQTGMIKINEKITSCGAVFCTFRNVARKETRTVKSEEKTKKKKKVEK